MKIGIVVQARMGSKRFPGKVLHNVRGRPLLDYLMERLERCAEVGERTVAIPQGPMDDSLAAHCVSRNYPYFRGHPEDVAARLGEAAERAGLDAFVRINGDSPLLDPALVDRAAREFRHGGYEIVTNVLERTFPRGQSVELLRTGFFNRTRPEFSAPEDREHVTPYFYRNKDRFRILNFKADADCSSIRLTIDRPGDVAFFESILDRMSRPVWSYSWKEIMELGKTALPGTDR